MTTIELTVPAQPLSSGAMAGGQSEKPRRSALLKKGAVLGALTLIMQGLAGCISVNAPDKPIVIELNINIKQEVVYKLAPDAGKTIDNHPEIF
jgi:hypothetical protein